MTSLSSPSTLNGFQFPSSFKPLFDLEMMKNEAKAATSPHQQQSQMYMQGSSANQQLQNSAVLQGANPQQQQQLMQAWISAMQMCREKIATDNSNLNSVLQLLGFSNQPAVQKQQQSQKQNKNKVNELFLSNLLLNQQQKNKSTLESILQQQNNKNQFQAWAAQLGIFANKSATSDNDRGKIDLNILSRSISNKKPSLCPYTSTSFHNCSNKTYKANISALSLPAITGYPQILKNKGLSSPSTETKRSITDNDETNTSTNTISSQEKPVFSTTWDPPRVYKPSNKKSRKRSNGYVSFMFLVRTFKVTVILQVKFKLVFNYK